MLKFINIKIVVLKSTNFHKNSHSLHKYRLHMESNAFLPVYKQMYWVFGIDDGIDEDLDSV